MNHLTLTERHVLHEAGRAGAYLVSTPEEREAARSLRSRGLVLYQEPVAGDQVVPLTLSQEGRDVAQAAAIVNALPICQSGFPDDSQRTWPNWHTILAPTLPYTTTKHYTHQRNQWQTK